MNTDSTMGMPTTSGSLALSKLINQDLPTDTKSRLTGDALVPGNAKVIDQLVNAGCISKYHSVRWSDGSQSTYSPR
jgi:hypothetical protein